MLDSVLLLLYSFFPPTAKEFKTETLSQTQARWPQADPGHQESSEGCRWPSASGEAQAQRAQDLAGSLAAAGRQGSNPGLVRPSTHPQPPFPPEGQLSCRPRRPAAQPPSPQIRESLARTPKPHAQKAEATPCGLGRGRFQPGLSAARFPPLPGPQRPGSPAQLARVCQHFPLVPCCLRPQGAAVIRPLQCPEPRPSQAWLQTHTLQLSRAPRSRDGRSASFWSSSSLVPRACLRVCPPMASALRAPNSQWPATLPFLSCFLEL